MNVLSAVLLGPYYAVAQAFCVSLLRNLMGTGSTFAFPGSMVGALLASLLFLKTRKLYLAFIGEVIGTGITGCNAFLPNRNPFSRPKGDCVWVYSVIYF